MDKNGKFNLKSVLLLARGSEEWEELVAWQKERILGRLNRYNNRKTSIEQLKEMREQSPYQTYKINVVSNYLLEALAHLEAGHYGTCKYCGSEIPNQRLLLIPAALQCMNCEKERPAS